MEIKDRIKIIRKEKQITQVEFGKIIGVKGNTVTNYETGLRIPTDAVIKSICREFNVNETWLRTGEGEMFIAKTRNQQLADFVNDVMEDVNDSFRKRFLEALSKLSVDEWKVIEKIADELAKKES